MSRGGRDSRKLLDNEQTVMPLCRSPPLPPIFGSLSVTSPPSVPPTPCPLSVTPTTPCLLPLLPIDCHPYYPLSVSQTTLSITPTALCHPFLSPVSLFPPKHPFLFPLPQSLFSSPSLSVSTFPSVFPPSLPPVSVPAH